MIYDSGFVRGKRGESQIQERTKTLLCEENEMQRDIDSKVASEYFCSFLIIIIIIIINLLIISLIVFVFANLGLD